jgi:hypothetical protein
MQTFVFMSDPNYQKNNDLSSKNFKNTNNQDDGNNDNSDNNNIKDDNNDNDNDDNDNDYKKMVVRLVISNDKNVDTSLKSLKTAEIRKKLLESVKKLNISKKQDIKNVDINSNNKKKQRKL